MNKAFRIILKSGLVIVALFLVLVLAIQLPFVQNKVKDQAVQYLQKKIKTKVVIGTVAIGLPKKIVLSDFYFEDQSKDTLLAGKSIKVDIDLFQLLNNTVQINSVDMDQIVAKIKVNKDTVYNFDYIIKAFASAEKSDKESEPTAFSIKKINLDKVKFSYQDAVSQNDLALFIHHFDTKIKKIDLEHLAFDIPDIRLNGFELFLNQDVVEVATNVAQEVSDNASSKKVKLNLKTIQLDAIKVRYKNAITQLGTQIQLGKLHTEVESIDLEKQQIKFNSIELNNTSGELTLFKNKPKQTTTDEKTEIQPWYLHAKTISIGALNFKFDNENAKTSNGIDYQHLKINDLFFEGRDIAIQDDAYKGKIEQLQFKEKSGFHLKELSTQFEYSNRGIILKNLKLKTPQTDLQNAIAVRYPSLNTLSDHLEDISLDVRLTNSSLGLKDVLLFAPKLQSNDFVKNNSKAILNFNAVAKGRLDNLTVTAFNAYGVGATKINFKGVVTGLPKIENSNFKIPFLDIQSTANDILALAPKNTIPHTIQIPEQFHLKGDFFGSIASFKTNLNLNSSIGKATVRATFDNRRKNNEKYIADVKVDNFDVGQLIKNKELGRITATANIKGVRLDPALASATFTSKVIKATYNKYNYQNINLSASVDKGTYQAKANAVDPNLTFSLNAKGASLPEKPTLNLKLNADIIDLNKLNLHAGPLKMRGTLHANFEDLRLDNLNGVVQTSDFLVALEKEQFPVDSIHLKAISTATSDSIILRSPFINGWIRGNYKLSTIGNQLLHSVSKYYQLGEKYEKSKESQQFDFQFKVQDSPIMKKIIPELKELSISTLTGGYNSVTDSIAVKALMPRINYGANEVSNGILVMNTQKDSLQYELSFDALKNEQFAIQKTAISGTVANNVVTYELSIKDVKEKDKYKIAGAVKDSLGATVLRFDPEKLLLNYENWTVSSNNTIKLAPKGILFTDFTIQNGNQSFAVQSERNVETAPVVATFNNFKLETLSSIVQSNFEIGGIINGETTIKNLKTNPLFESDLDVQNLRVKQDSIGDLQIKVTNKKAGFYTANVQLTGAGNQLSVAGNYNIDNQNLDFKMAIEKLQMKSLQAFTVGNLKESEGYLSGQLNITGKSSSPLVEGKMKFNKVGFVVSSLNSKFLELNDEIIFQKNKIAFDNFKLYDENKNPLLINGFVDTQEYTNVGFNLQLTAKNFRMVNSKIKDNKLFYGELYLDNNLGIKGTLNSPVIDGTLKVNEDTKFTVVIPQSDPSIADREGIVEFIDQDQPVLIDLQPELDAITQTEVKGITASVNIVVDKKAEISIVIDEANGDYLKLQGDAQLTGGIDPSGKTTLTGKYEFTGGTYEMNFNLIKRKFEIQPQSYILWTGEPTLANINITAVYKVEASPLDLVDDQLAGITAETRNTYKQRIPFETNLMMKGSLLQPEISFDIVLPDGNNDVSAEVINTTQAKLEQLKRDEDAMNKQVFALLLLNRFIGDNPFESEAGGTSGSYLAKQSVSKILSQQLNNLAGDLIKGFEVDLDLQASEDYTSGQKKERTDLNVGLSKQLFNDRLKVTLGSSFGVEGAQNENEQATNIAGDVRADYLITKDGRYKLRAYRKNNYQVALQGQVIETGVAFIITMNYNKFRELFHSKRKPREKKGNKNNENERN
ncbi:translocation/assembly module TamB [Flavobacterium sp. UMI-01]|uniref:translocation/assembly module TamB domain-containing protein n=1 Tax=Flavobacterium sp. UMI-01 TaxID=1441053 RepID=UPI001C7DA0DD|nr:translocation/assembly module TamB [Flavobacterium sp. UMI-01]GIZ07661.1 hypothetical protein FUMI01_03880 [Flavobacterium sp. UMI-01]